MAGSVTDLESPGPFNEWDYFQNPVFPVTQGNACRDEIVSEGELMIEKVEEDAQKFSHKDRCKKRV